MDIKSQTLVKNKNDGRIGVVVSEPWETCVVEEFPVVYGVVYEGETALLATFAEDLEVIGPENAIADMEKCGAGKGKECCVFLVFGGRDGKLVCGRFESGIRWNLIAREGKMKAKRHPTEMYPKCQLC